jgi:hypothetical protein
MCLHQHESRYGSTPAALVKAKLFHRSGLMTMRRALRKTDTSTEDISLLMCHHPIAESLIACELPLSYFHKKFTAL